MRRRERVPAGLRPGYRVSSRYFTLIVCPPQRRLAGAARLGIVASRKLGDAVRRNRAKRLIREVFRHLEPLPVAAARSRRDPPPRIVRCSLQRPRARFPHRLAARRLAAPACPCRLTLHAGDAVRLERRAARRAGADPRLSAAVLPHFCRLVPVPSLVLAPMPPKRLSDTASSAVAALAIRRLMRCHPFGGHGDRSRADLDFDSN